MKVIEVGTVGPGREVAYKDGFRLGAFRSRITPDGPDELKSWTNGKRHFTFI